ncbi:MAG: sugar nucleotide-binding protein [Verrucomicrobiota bacterium]|nr:sugar nucleotide-binding protein [Verrucomicrobiota bacterium]
MRVVVLGSQGMLGSVVFKYLRKAHMDVVALDARWCPENASILMERLLALVPDACINAVGILPGRGACSDNMSWVNGTLPGWIASRLPVSCVFVHPSSDAVFDSTCGGCHWDTLQQPDSLYGQSKQQGELGLRRMNDRIIRSSIVGIEKGPPRSLLSWFLACEQTVSGYINHQWNGITTLEWSQLCHRILSGGMPDANRVLQPGVLPPLSKYSLLKMTARIFGHSISIKPVKSATTISRTLVPNPLSRGLEAQLCELREWHACH